MLVTNGVTVGQPEVGLILPVLAGFADVTNGVTVAQPEVGLILPALVSSPDLTNGITVAQPEVGLILPVGPNLDSSSLGLTVAEPVVMLRFASSFSALNDGTGANGSAPVLRLLQVQTNSRTVGLNTNWFDVPGSSATNSVSMPISPANGAVFYRLKL